MPSLSKTIEEEIQKGANGSVIDLVDGLIGYAHESRASDIHIDPSEKGVRVRLRVDGVLRQHFLIPKEMHDMTISRIKVLAGLRTDEHQKAQDGRFRIEIEEESPVDIRVSIAPTYYGENVVLRLLTDKDEKFTLEALGFSASDQEKIEHAAQQPTGMILATGPTGSGKTTTLYTILKSLNTEEVAIITIEDPIEYAVGGIEQIQVNHTSGLNFANGLRSILRQDPNIIMVGEIRDTETAGIAVNAALTGHLLLSTLHTNDASTTLPRLLDMGIEPYLVASTVNVIVGQRLVRKLCEKCKKSHAITDAEKKRMHEISKNISVPQTLYEPGSCEGCNDSGYHGRVAINEVLVVDRDIRDAILSKASAETIRDIAVAGGMTTMLVDGMQKASDGVTTIEEVLRAVKE